MATISTSMEIFQRVLDRGDNHMSKELARYVQGLGFPAEDHARHQELCTKASDGTLNAEERELLESYIEADGVLSLLKLRAARALRA